MSGKNKYTAELQKMFRLGVETGIRIGTQFDWDCMQLALRDKEAMGKDTLGRGRIAKLFKAHKKYRSKFAATLTNEAESDHLQERLDDNLRLLWGDELIPFAERYEELRTIDYRKPKKDWR